MKYNLLLYIDVLDDTNPSDVHRIITKKLHELQDDLLSAGVETNIDWENELEEELDEE